MGIAEAATDLFALYGSFSGLGVNSSISSAATLQSLTHTTFRIIQVSYKSMLIRCFQVDDIIRVRTIA